MKCVWSIRKKSKKEVSSPDSSKEREEDGQRFADDADDGKVVRVKSNGKKTRE